MTNPATATPAEPAPPEAPPAPLVFLDREAIKAILPHRDQALVVDSAYFNPNTGEIHTTWLIPESYTWGHFGFLPGHWITEAMNLAVAILGLKDQPPQTAVLLGRQSGLEFKRPVKPGETLRVEASIDEVRMGVIRGRAKAFVGSEFVAAIEKVIGSLVKPPKPVEEPVTVERKEGE